MTRRVLLVDDEPNLLSGLTRRLGSDYEIVTACSGAAGLVVIADGPPFPVVVTDMRMPKMNGVQFIQAARAKSPDSVFLMLTGNQDQATAIQAMNDGHVFRFLTKPCHGPDLAAAIDAGLRQHQLITSEKELLQGTFDGALSVLTDVLELAQPSIFGRAERVHEIVTILQESLRLESQWEYRVAARLALLGFALLPEQDRLRFESGAASGRALHGTIRAAAAIGRRVIERIPRLGAVAQIIGMMADIDGNMLLSRFRTDSERVVTGTTLLRVAIEWDYLVRQGMSSRAAVDEMSAALPNLPVMVAMILAAQHPARSQAANACERSVLFHSTALHDEALASDGKTPIRRGSAAHRDDHQAAPQR